jgi:predicted MarR family transcription regulator
MADPTRFPAQQRPTAVARERGAEARPRGRTLDRQWHLASDAYEVGITEFEFAIFRVAAALERWQSDCLATCHAGAFSGTDTALLHVIRMHDRPKSISELGRLLKRDDVSNLQYGVRKLLKAGLIQRAKEAGSKRDVTYCVTASGRDVTDKYAETRRELLLSMTREAAGEVDFETVARTMNLMAAMYDQASCVAATHRVNDPA